MFNNKRSFSSLALDNDLPSLSLRLSRMLDLNLRYRKEFVDLNGRKNKEPE